VSYSVHPVSVDRVPGFDIVRELPARRLLVR
jgi:hypothetical protein